MKIQFLGAARQVTGSQYYIATNGVRLLVDCGMFQEREFLERNWAPSPLPLNQIDAVLLTHAHVDHCGLLPKLVREGLRAPVYATSASADLVELVLRDAAEIQKEDAAFKRKRHRKEGRRGKYPVKPLYTLKDVDRALPLLRKVKYGEEVLLDDGVTAVFHDAGHILGSAMIQVRYSDTSPPRSVLFSGDIGQRDKPFVRDPTTFADTDYLVMESTYGSRTHGDQLDVETHLAEVVLETYARGGKVIIPVFAIERAQELVYYLGRLVRVGRIPPLPVFLDSPMAADVIDIFRRHENLFDAETEAMINAGHSPLRFAGLRTARTTAESKAINALSGPAIIMATSGMCVAGRIKHHLARHISDPSNTVLFVSYQARGTLGRQILDGLPEVRIHGQQRLVRARVVQIHGFSGHADRPALLDWLTAFQRPPLRVFLTHGEEQEAQALGEAIRQQFGWEVSVPNYQETVDIC